MFLSGALLMLWGEETHPRLNHYPAEESRDQVNSHSSICAYGGRFHLAVRRRDRIRGADDYSHVR